MKKSIKIVLGIFAVALVTVGIVGFNIYQTVTKSEDITGKQGKVPQELKELPPLYSGQDDWVNWRGKNFDGKSEVTGIIKDWSKGLKKVWEVDFLCQDRKTATWSTPVIKGNRLVVPGRDEENDLVFCLNSEDGSLIWKGSYKAEAGNAHGPGARATPYIDGDKVYTYGRSGDLVCWDLFDGKKIWHKNVKDLGCTEPDFGFSSSPLVIGNNVIVQAGGEVLVVAYNKNTGDVAWKSQKGPGGYTATIPFNISGEQTILIYHAKGLSCLNPDDGKLHWQTEWEAPYDVNATTPVINNDIVFHTTGYGTGGQALKATKTGAKVVWANEVIASHHSDPFIIDGYIYGYSGQSNRNKGDFKCVELKTGKEIWSTDELGYGTCIYADGHIICLDLKGNLFLVKPSPNGYEKVTEQKEAIPEVKSTAWTAPVIANGKLYLRYLQRLVCYDLMD